MERLTQPGGGARPGHDETAAFRRDLVAALSATPKVISPKWFYDAEGSRLFEDITRLAEYYPTRQETALLRKLAPAYAVAFGPGADLIEFGSGASEKTRLLLDAAPDLTIYVPIDISPDALHEAAVRISRAYPRLAVRPVVGDFLHLDRLPDDLGGARRIGFFPGSTIGNLTPEEAVDFLASARRLLGEGGLFILGVDLVKEVAVLEAAYDDARGVTAAFNLNLLVRANRELDADFDPGAFEHRAVWNAEWSRMEMHLVACHDQTVRVGGHAFRFRAGESLHTESSRKFTESSVRDMAGAAGWTVARFDTGPAPSVGLALLRG